AAVAATRCPATTAGLRRPRGTAAHRVAARWPGGISPIDRDTDAADPPAARRPRRRDRRQPRLSVAVGAPRRPTGAGHPCALGSLGCPWMDGRLRALRSTELA